MSISWQTDAEPRARILVLPPDVHSLDEAHAAIELWEFYSRKTLDPSQRLAVEVMMAESGGRWAARTTGREMPRQNGKGDELEVVELWGIVQRGESILHTAHELTTVSKAHERMARFFIEGHADLRRMKRKILNGIGQQLILVHNKKTGLDGVIAYRTRTNGGGRGLDDISRLVVDEAQHAQPEQLASSTPILLANPNPQMNFAGTAAIAGVSDWWWSLRKRALGSAGGQFGYVGHTAENVYLDGEGRVVQEPVDAQDRSIWPGANPAMIAGRGDPEFFEEQLRTLGPELFAREHLGVWDPPPPESGSVVDMVRWAGLADPESLIASGEQLALDVSIDRRFSSFAAAGRRVDGRFHVEVFDRRPGTGWVLDRAVEAHQRSGRPVRILSGSPASSFVPLLIERGVEVVEVPPGDHAKAVGQFLDAVENGDIAHLGGSVLSSALAGAALKATSDAVTWGRRTSKVDISPLVAVTVALGGVPAPQKRAPRIHVLQEVT